MALSVAGTLVSNFARTSRAAAHAYAVVRVRGAVIFGVAAALAYRAARQDFYNILWAVVFGFATLNILSLAAKKFEPGRRGLTFGELMAVLVVFISLFLLGWEMLNIFHIFPIRLSR